MWTQVRLHSPKADKLSFSNWNAEKEYQSIDVFIPQKLILICAHSERRACILLIHGNEINLSSKEISERRGDEMK